ncbi:MAG: PD40 domain-containing protein [Chthonomonadaceae bacterium]|nr:PD40 domain-containing protein [Chthonomonadaceae bacterium]
MLIQALTLALTLQFGTADMRLMRFPAVHGDTVVFTFAGDLWTSKKDGGFARRLTSHFGGESRARFSPDGKWLAFTGTYEGNADVYVMPAEGGEPVRLTFEPDTDIVLNWTPDGKIAYASTYGSFTNRQQRLWLVDPKGGLPISTDLIEVSDLSYSPDGRKAAYNRFGSHAFNWRRYRGGSQGKISFWDFPSQTYSEIPSAGENSWEPMWVGDTIYYISDKNQSTVNLYAYDTKSKRTEQLTKFTDADIKWPSTDGKTIVFERDGYLYDYDLASKKVERLTPTVRGDMLSARPELKELGNQISNFSLSPSGVRLAAEARGEIFSVPAKHGDTRDLTETPGAREQAPDWSPDGKTIAYMSDESGEVQIYTRPQMGGPATQVSDEKTNRIQAFRWSPKGDKISFSTVKGQVYLLDPKTKSSQEIFAERFGGTPPYDWSPDGNWIAYIANGENLFGALYLYEVATGTSHKVTEGYFPDQAVSFDLNGKYLYLISGRTFIPTPGDFEFIMQMENSQRVYLMTLSKDESNPLVPPSDEEKAGDDGKKEEGGNEKPEGMKVDLDGLAARVLPLPMPPGTYNAVVGANNGVYFFSDRTLQKFDLGSREASPIIAGASSLAFNAKRTKLAYQGGGVIGIIDARPGQKLGDGKVNVSGVEAVIDPRAEWRQIFWEAWRYERDHFYDAEMLGLNWDAIGKHYAELLPYVAHRNDLNYVIGLMIGELGTSHAYVGGGDMGDGPPPIPTGQLGADYESHANKIRFKKIYYGLNFDESRRGPLGEPGVNIKEGEYLLAIDGKPLGADTNPDSLLVNKAGKTVTLTVNDRPGMEGSREVRVHPIASEGQLRYIEWVEANRRWVSEATGGKVGYMHVPDTSMPGVIEFIKGYYSQSDKQAMIIDERFNGGGMIPTFFIERLGRQVATALKQRNGEDIKFPTQTFQGPMAMMINGYAGSGGDMFPWLFQNAKMGPLIGTRTWGGLVGIQGGAPLIDGGFLSSPEFGIYDVKTGKWIAENTGVTPDIEVDARPDLVAKGQDPQLAKAVEYLMEQLKKGSVKYVEPKGYPRVGGGGGS